MEIRHCGSVVIIRDSWLQTTTFVEGDRRGIRRCITVSDERQIEKLTAFIRRYGRLPSHSDILNCRYRFTVPCQPRPHTITVEIVNGRLHLHGICPEEWDAVAQLALCPQRGCRKFLQMLYKFLREREEKVELPEALTPLIVAIRLIRAERERLKTADRYESGQWLMERLKERFLEMHPIARAILQHLVVAPTDDVNIVARLYLTISLHGVPICRPQRCSSAMSSTADLIMMGSIPTLAIALAERPFGSRKWQPVSTAESIIEAMSIASSTVRNTVIQLLAELREGDGGI